MSLVSEIIEQNRIESGCATKCDRNKCKVLSHEFAKLKQFADSVYKEMHEVKAENAKMREKLK